jgi:uncharacterized protein YbjT (DUF2867 family)
MRWTILRPAGFMENFEAGSVGKIAAGAWRIATQDRQFAMIATKDIGWRCIGLASLGRMG